MAFRALLAASTHTGTPRDARRDADRRQRPAIDPAGLLVEVEDALSSRLLRYAGVDPFEVQRVLLETTGRRQTIDRLAWLTRHSGSAAS